MNLINGYIITLWLASGLLTAITTITYQCKYQKIDLTIKQIVLSSLFNILLGPILLVIPLILTIIIKFTKIVMLKILTPFKSNCNT
jgi:hypothetical protein